MKAGSAVPAAQGTVKATKDSNGNTDLVVDVKHLARPDMIASDATVYLVWIESHLLTVRGSGYRFVPD